MAFTTTDSSNFPFVIIPDAPPANYESSKSKKSNENEKSENKNQESKLINLGGGEKKKECKCFARDFVVHVAVPVVGAAAFVYAVPIVVTAAGFTSVESLLVAGRALSCLLLR
jgi:hypothetical protein